MFRIVYFTGLSEILVAAVVLHIRFPLGTVNHFSPLVMVLISVVVANMLRHSGMGKEVLLNQAAKMNRNKRAALHVFKSSLPVGTRRYVTQPTDPVDETETEAEREGGLPENAMEEQGVEGPEEADVPQVEQTPGTDAVQMVPDCPVYPGVGEQAQRQRNPPVSDTCIPSERTEYGPGMITTEDNVVIGFLGVVPTAEGVPAAAYIKNLITLMQAIDGLQSLFKDIEKIKGSDGVLIVRVRASQSLVCSTNGVRDQVGPQTEREREAERETEAQMVARDCRLMARFMCKVSIYASALLGDCVSDTVIAGMRGGIACGSVTAGVLGTCELMYDVFGDTVNTAARLMSKASVSQVLVSEEVCEHISNRPRWDGHSLLGPERHGFQTLIQSRPKLLFLKGKGIYPIRQILFSRPILHRLRMNIR
ncbi:hypothetical protein KIPB_011707, partial [Kipferlia bialata]|eukprot:g11707.t1